MDHIMKGFKKLILGLFLTTIIGISFQSNVKAGSFNITNGFNDVQITGLTSLSNGTYEIKSNLESYASLGTLVISNDGSIKSADVTGINLDFDVDLHFDTGVLEIDSDNGRVSSAVTAVRSAFNGTTSPLTVTFSLHNSDGTKVSGSVDGTVSITAKKPVVTIDTSNSNYIIPNGATLNAYVENNGSVYINENSTISSDSVSFQSYVFDGETIKFTLSNDDVYSLHKNALSWNTTPTSTSGNTATYSSFDRNADYVLKYDYIPVSNVTLSPSLNVNTEIAYSAESTTRTITVNGSSGTSWTNNDVKNILTNDGCTINGDRTSFKINLSGVSSVVTSPYVKIVVKNGKITDHVVGDYEQTFNYTMVKPTILDLNANAYSGKVGDEVTVTASLSGINGVSFTVEPYAKVSSKSQNGNVFKFTPSAANVEYTVTANPNGSVEGDPSVLLTYTSTDGSEDTAYFTQDILYLAKGAKVNLNKYFYVGDGLKDAKMTIEALDDDVVTVAGSSTSSTSSSSFKLTGKATGDTTLTLSVGGITDTMEVEVLEEPTFTISGSAMTVTMPDYYNDGKGHETNIEGFVLDVYYGAYKVASTGTAYAKTTGTGIAIPAGFLQGVVNNQAFQENINAYSGGATSVPLEIRLYPYNGSKTADVYWTQSATLYRVALGSGVTTPGNSSSASGNFTYRVNIGGSDVGRGYFYTLQGQTFIVTAVPDDNTSFSKWTGLNTSSNNPLSYTHSVTNSGNLTATAGTSKSSSTSTTTTTTSSSSSKSSTAANTNNSNTTNNSGNAGSRNSSDYDDVPKTGESKTDIWILWTVLFVSILGAGFMIYKRFGLVKAIARVEEEERIEAMKAKARKEKAEKEEQIRKITDLRNL